MKATRSPRPWSQFEQQLNQFLARLFGDEAQRIAERIQQHGSGTLTDEATWQAYQQRLLAELTPLFERMVQQFITASVRNIPDVQELQVNWGLVNQRAAEWAQQYAGELISGVTKTTRQSVRDQLAQWVDAKETLPALIERITNLQKPTGGSMFGLVRSEMIAVTEATNVYAEANAIAWQAAGVLPAVFKPAGHVRCRCWLTTKKLPDGRRVMVWQTARDDLVCVQDIQTPWKVVAGCRELHNTIVSECEYLGQKWNAL